MILRYLPGQFPLLTFYIFVTEPFEWTAPLVSSNVVAPSLTTHTADLVENYMIAAFGK